MMILPVLAGLAVAAGGSALWWNRQLARKAERRFPPLGRFIKVAGLRLHYLDRGRGPAIVLLHGANGSLRDWLPGIVERLEQDFRVIAFDRPGHGFSDPLPPGESPTPAAQARILRAAIRQLGIERPILGGFSLGCSLVAAWGLAWPDEVGAGVMLAGALQDWPTPTARIYDLPAVPVVGRLAVEMLSMPLGRLLAARWIDGVFAPDPVPEGFAAAPVALAARPQSFLVNAAERRLIKRFLAEQSRHYPDFKPPLVLLAGDGDRVVSTDIHSRQMHEAVPGSELTVLRGAGHMLPHCHPDECVAAIRRGHDLARRTMPTSA